MASDDQDPTVDHELAAALFGTRSWYAYAAYIVLVALVDVTALLRLSSRIDAWVHITITLTLSAVAIAIVSYSLYARGKSSTARAATIRRLLATRP